MSSLDAELTDEEKKTEWPLFTLEELAYKDLSPAMLNGRGIKAKECLMWNEFIPKLAQMAGKFYLDVSRTGEGVDDVMTTS